MNPQDHTESKTASDYPQDGRKVFFKKGTCSKALFYMVNRHYDNNQEETEAAADPLAGGILQMGYQCGMIWGSSLAVGAESFRKYKDHGKAVAMAILATRNLIESFTERTGSPDCKTITKCDWSNPWSIAKHFITGRAFNCYNLAKKWAPEAIQTVENALENPEENLPKNSTSCAMIVARNMGASDEEALTVSGFAGGLGLSGNACGALAAAIWVNRLEWSRLNQGKPPMNIPEDKRTLEAFNEATGSEILCSKICGKCFGSVKEHTDYINDRGCENIINALSEVKA